MISPKSGWIATCSIIQTPVSLELNGKTDNNNSSTVGLWARDQDHVESAAERWLLWYADCRMVG